MFLAAVFQADNTVALLSSNVALCMVAVILAALGPSSHTCPLVLGSVQSNNVFVQVAAGWQYVQYHLYVFG